MEKANNSNNTNNANNANNANNDIVQTVAVTVPRPMGPLCTSSLLVLRSSERDRYVYPLPSAYTMPLGSLYDVYALTVEHVAFPTTPMTIEGAEDYTVACEDVAHHSSSSSSLGKKSQPPPSFGNSAVVIGEGFPVSSEAPPIHINEGPNTLLFDMPVTLIDVVECTVVIEDDEKEEECVNRFACPISCTREGGGGGGGGGGCAVLSLCTASPHGYLQGDQLFLLGVSGGPGIGPFCVSSVESRTFLTMDVGNDRIALAVAASPQVRLFYPPQQTPEAHASLFGGRFGRFVGTHYLTLTVKISRGDDDIPACGEALSLTLPVGTCLQWANSDEDSSEGGGCGSSSSGGGGCRSSSGSGSGCGSRGFLGRTVAPVSASEFVTGQVVVLVEHRGDLSLCGGELLEICGGVPCWDGRVYLQTTCVAPFRSGASPLVSWCASRGVFEATLASSMYAKRSSLDVVVTKGLFEPYAISRSVEFGQTASSEWNAVAGAARLHLQPGFYQTAREVGAALYRAINAPTLEEERVLVYQTSRGEKRARVPSGSFTAEGAAMAMQLAVGDDAVVIVRSAGSSEAVLGIRSHDPFFFLDVSRNPWLSAFGFDITGCNHRHFSEGGNGRQQVMVARNPFNVRRRTGGGLCSKTPMGRPLVGTYGVRVSPIDAGTLAIVMEPGTLEGRLGISHETGALTFTMVGVTSHLTAGAVIILGGIRPPRPHGEKVAAKEDVEDKTVDVEDKTEDSEEKCCASDVSGLYVIERVSYQAGSGGPATMETVFQFQYRRYGDDGDDGVTDSESRDNGSYDVGEGIGGIEGIEGCVASLLAAQDGFGIYAQNVDGDSGGVTGFQRDRPFDTCHGAEAPVIVPPTCTVLIRVGGIGGQVSALSRTGAGRSDFTTISAVAAVELTRDRPGTFAFPRVASASCPNGARNGMGCSIKEISVELVTPDGKFINFHGADNTIWIRLQKM